MAAASTSAASNEPSVRSRSAGAPSLGRAYFWYGAVAAALLAVAFERFVFSGPLAHAGSVPALPRALPLAAAAAGTAAGMWPRSRKRVAQATPWRLCALALVGAASGPLWFVAFATPALFTPLLVVVPAASAWLSVNAARGVVHTLLPLGRLAGLPRLGPLRVAAFCGVWFSLHAALELLGLWRESALLASALSVLAAWFVTLHEELERRAYPRARSIQGLAALCFALSAASVLVAARTLPAADDVAARAGTVLYASSGPHPAVVARSPIGYELWLGRALRVPALDAPRYFESLIHPAMTLAARPARVLVVSLGDGMAEREVLRYPEVESVTAVVFSSEVAELSRTLPWLRERSESSLLSERVRLVVEEPSAWLEQTQARFNVVVLDAPDPEGYLEGKYYTRHFYRLMRDRLASNGILVVQATSAFTTPKTASTLEATLKAAGFHTRRYHAPVQSYGIWTFVLASRAALPPRERRPLPAGLEFLNRAGMAALFVEPRDLVLDREAAPSLLFYQRAVHRFEEEREGL